MTTSVLFRSSVCSRNPFSCLWTQLNYSFAVCLRLCTTIYNNSQWLHAFEFEIVKLVKLVLYLVCSKCCSAKSKIFVLCYNLSTMYVVLSFKLKYFPFSSYFRYSIILNTFSIFIVIIYIMKISFMNTFSKFIFGFVYDLMSKNLQPNNNKCQSTLALDWSFETQKVRTQHQRIVCSFIFYLLFSHKFC